MARTIIHADLDAFYASVEQLDNPELRGKPVVVGGSPESRGVVTAASYEVRAFGVRSAMAMSRALRLCPDAVRVPPRFDRYAAVSRVVMRIFRDLTPLVEPLSLDEAFLDVSGWADDGARPIDIAQQLRAAVREASGLIVSIGCGSNKTVAKIASDHGKPNGLVVVPAGEEATFLAPMPVRALWGIGPKTDARLAPAGIRTIGDLARCADADARRLLGSSGEFLRDMARGIDDRAVIVDHERKSIGAETTFARDLPDGADLRAQLRRIAVEVGERMRGHNSRAHTVALKLRYAHFHTVTRQSSTKTPIDDAAQIEAIAIRLLDAIVERGDQFRLLGIQCSRLVEGGTQQSLWDAEPAIPLAFQHSASDGPS